MSLNKLTDKPKLDAKTTPTNYIVLPEQVEEEARIARIEFYRTTTPKIAFFYMSVILTAGILALLSKWQRSIYVALKYVKGNPRNANYLVIHCIDGTIDYVKVRERSMFIDGATRVYRVFKYRLYLFYHDQMTNQFKPIEFVIRNKTFAQIHKEMGKGFQTEDAYQQRLSTYGRNSTDLPEKSSFTIIVDEILSPFYLFQLFAVIFWGFFNNYEAYAGFIFGISVITLAIEFYKIKSNHRKLRQKAFFEIPVNVFRTPEEVVRHNEILVKMIPKSISSTWLVPGDLVEIPSDQKMPCDILLVNGTCVMNEGMLTGESIPVIKQQLPSTDKQFNASTAEQYTLFAGTECLETRKASPDMPVLGIVLRTGFATMKGRLIRSFIYSKPEDFKFYKDSLKYVGAMALLALVCFGLSVKSFVDQGQDAGYIVRKSLDIITIAVPPALPTVVAIGSALASVRLEKQKIVTKSEMKINVAGKVKFMCFDKTGTLTNDSLDLHGVRCLTKSGTKAPKFTPIVVDNVNASLDSFSQKTLSHKMLELMATCHSLTRVKGNISGDPLDARMFEATGWTYIENYGSAGFDFRIATLNPPENSADSYYFKQKSDVVVLKRFEFSPKLQRMSVIIKDIIEGKQRVYVKGSPEVMATLCKPDTLPPDFNDILLTYTQSGLRVIACGTKVMEKDVLTNDDLPREPFECDLEFIGFLIFENKLKEVTPSIIKKLKDADIKTIMLTGDNPLTAIFVSRDCGIVDQDQRVVLGTLVTRDEDNHLSKDIEWRFIDPVKLDNHNYDDNTPLNQAGTPQKTFAVEMSQMTHLTPQQDKQDKQLGRAKSMYRRDGDIIPQKEVMEMLQQDPALIVAMTGDAFNFFDSSPETSFFLRDLVLKKSKVLARMRPDDKAFVIDKIQKQGYTVGMCGDGANDCPGLKVANVGVSLSEAEASLAAPFMSKVIDIACIDILLREGRTALVTSFQCFKFMSIYSLIQAFSVVILYSRASAMTDPCFMYQDFIMIIPAAFTMSLTLPTDKLSKQEPTGTLLSIPVLSCMVGQCLIQAAAQYIAVTILESQDWYVSPTDLLNAALEVAIAEAGEDEEAIAAAEEETTAPDYDITILFLVGSVQYFATVMAFSIGKPFRQPFYKNIWFTLAVFVTLVLTIIVILVPMPAFYEAFEMKDFPDQGFKWIVIAIVAVNTVATIAFEKFLVPIVFAVGKRMFERRRQKKENRYTENNGL